MPDTSLELLDRIVAAMSGTKRDNQHEMAAAVDGVIGDGGVLLVQAGTGTGKSLGYLAPAIHAAVEEDRRTVVSTATLALQRQLVERDIPAALDALNDDPDHGSGGGSAPVRAAVLKGRGNYICLARVSGDAQPDQDELGLSMPGGRLELQAAALRRWAQRTETGDRDDYPDVLDPRVWRAMAATGRECVGPAKCAFADDCFSERAKRKAADASIIVTNHALLALDALDDIAVLPEYDVLIVDEAHDLGARLTSAGAQQLSVTQVERAESAARSLVGEDVLERLADARDGLAAAFAELPSERSRLLELPPRAVTALAVVRDAATVAVTALPADTETDPHRRHRALAALTELHDIAGRVLAMGAGDVVWFGGSADPQVHVAPLQVGPLIGGYLRDLGAAVLTSATLTVGGEFSAVAAELGLGDAWTGVDVGSPFDYAKQGILHVAADLPPPGRAGMPSQTLDAIRELVVAAGGRTLVLLSSWRAVAVVAEHLAARPIPGVAVLVQEKGDPVAGLVSRFASDETSVLVGTMSLFQGVDVPGASCISVIIDRIPFPRPDEPVLQARSDRVERDGGNGFMAVSVPRAALLLAQGVGRLIRTDADRGVVTVLDPRLSTARYGTYLRRSLPPFWTTGDRATVVAALQRLAAARG